MKVTVGSLRPISRYITKTCWHRGIEALGDVYHRFQDVMSPGVEDVDCWYQFNLFNPYRPMTRIGRMISYRKILASGKPMLVWEEGSFRQLPQYKKIGWNTYLNTGDFNNQDVDGSRWLRLYRRHGLRVLDWESPGHEILIMGQVEFDSALISLYDAGYLSFNDWVDATIGEIRKHSDRPIRVRPHPKEAKALGAVIAELDQKHGKVAVSENLVGQTMYSGGVGLYLDLAQAHCVVTYTSNSAVEAVCEGIPVFAMSPENMAWDVAHHDLADIENLDYSIDTTQWCHRVAYTMWSPEEIEAGETWAHLKPVYFK